jgi:hypothetical protein
MSTNYWDLTDPSKVDPPTVNYSEAIAGWVQLVERYRETGEIDQGLVDLLVLAGTELVQIVSSTVRLAVQWDNATELTTGNPSVVTKAFAERLYAAMGMPGR